MSANTTIEWATKSWNPVRGCSRVSPGCDNCYAMKFAHRFSGAGKPYDGLTVLRPKTAKRPGVDWSGVARFIPEALDEPLRWRKPERIFVNSMSDLFHHTVSDEQIAAVFGVMAATQHHQHLVLTKRPGRAAELMNDTGFVARVELFKHVARAGRIAEFFAEERTETADGFPGYYVTSRGRVLSDAGSDVCLMCGAPNGDGIAKKKFCSRVCSQKAHYERQMGRWSEPAHAPREMAQDVGEQGHRRVPLYRDEAAEKLLVHRLVLSTFDRLGVGDEQACHIDGDPANNALWNLRWGTQEDNWADRKRHGNGQSWSKLTAAEVHHIRETYRRGLSVQQIANSTQFFGRVSDTQISNIVSGKQWQAPLPSEWPLSSVWLGVSVENQETADERIPLLLQCPAAVRWISAEPLLGPLNLHPWLCEHGSTNHPQEKLGRFCSPTNERIQWLVAGGESGPGARGMDIEWMRSLIEQCRAASVPVFSKQFGSRPYTQPPGFAPTGLIVHHPKGANLSEIDGSWPRDFPR